MGGELDVPTLTHVLNCGINARLGHYTLQSYEDLLGFILKCRNVALDQYQCNRLGAGGF
jgi:hypothetical protein